MHSEPTKIDMGTKKVKTKTKLAFYDKSSIGEQDFWYGQKGESTEPQPAIQLLHLAQGVLDTAGS